MRGMHTTPPITIFSLHLKPLCVCIVKVLIFAFARDLFMFGCWTGVSFVDIKNQTEDKWSL